jgi:chromosome segregation ATPase
MEFEQIIKRLDWLDEEHRKEKSSLEELAARLTAIEGELKVLTKKVKEQSSKLTGVYTVAARIEQFDITAAQQKSELVKYIDNLEAKRKGNLGEIDMRYQVQLDGLKKSIADLKKVKESVTEIKRELNARLEEETRHNKLLSEWETRMQALLKNAETMVHNLNLTEETRRQETKRLADMQGEVSAMRKQLEKTRGKSDQTNDGLLRVEARLNEIISSEAERRQSQTSLLETQARLQFEREQASKEWEEHLASLSKQTEAMDRHLLEWDTVQRALKRAQDTYEDLVQKFERRINEITEMQRLAEDRFRQEWISFKSDDQKRWTSHTLLQDESHKETRSDVSKLAERLTSVEDLAQTQQDVLQQTKEANEQLFQGMLSQIHELLSSYERIMGAK